jgi:hypothetical protein
VDGRDDPPARRGREDAGRVHRVLRAVAGAHRDLAAQHERHRALAAEHVPRLRDLVEQLVGGDPHEVGVHELDDGPEPAVERDAAAEPVKAFSLIGVPRIRPGTPRAARGWRRWCRR